MAKQTTKKTISKTKKMPKATTKKTKAIKVIKEMRTAPKLTAAKKINLNFLFFVKFLLIIAIGIVVFLLVQKNRGLFMAGVVNKSPVSRWELNSKMAEKYAEQTFEEIVSERLLEENLKKNDIVVTDQEVQKELADIKLQYGGEEQFQVALAQFGMTEEKALESIKQSIGLKKLIQALDPFEISETDIATYYEENKESFSEQTLEEAATEIENALIQQEIYTKSQEWYSKIRQDAKVTSYL